MKKRVITWGRLTGCGLLAAALAGYLGWLFLTVDSVQAAKQSSWPKQNIPSQDVDPTYFLSSGTWHRENDAVSGGSPVIDGVVDAAYGPPLATDPIDPPQGNAPMDMGDLYMTYDNDYLYIAFTVHDDIAATTWGKYLLYLDTTNDSNGASTDAWGRNVVVNDPHKPEFSLNTWVDAAPYGPEDTQLWAWDQGTTTWNTIGTVDAAALGSGATSVIEWQLSRAALGNPQAVWAEVYSTGGGTTDNAQDTVNNPADDWNATDWSTTAVLANSTYFTLPILIDGLIDAAYGPPIATDPADAPQGNLPMDLRQLYVTEDTDNFYIAFTINEDVAATNWGKYILYIDTTNDSDGAPLDAWGRNVVVNDPHKPEFSLNTWVDAAPYGPEDVQLWSWDANATLWTGPTTIISAALAAGTPSTIEWQLSKASLGHPDNLWVEVYSTGGGTTDNAQDTINNPADDWNATDWGTTAVLLNSTTYPPTAPPPGPDCLSGAAPDNNVWWADLGHNSRDTLYRTPGGPVITGTAVTLRLRAACDDLTHASVRVWNDRADISTMYQMSRVASDSAYDWWAVTLPPSTDPTIYWYRFLAVDGTDTAYYEDDDSFDGGWGQTYDTSPDYSWQLTIYDPAYQTPDWAKNAIIYQIFPDRFRDGDAGNNPPAGRFFYQEPGGTIFRSNGTDWNTVVCDPRDPADCPGDFSDNFYGGDLQGIMDQLDYLQDLGVTTIYFNPIFASPSNHKYDTADFSQISADFGDLNTFITLTNEAHTRGINVVLDGVFNHTSSDSPYFDLYRRFDAAGNNTSPGGPGADDDSGACESPGSPYRSWFYIPDIGGPANGPTDRCDPNDGDDPTGPWTETYEAWFGFGSLPKLNSSNTAVRDLIWSGGPSAIARYWMQWADGWRLDVGGDVDPGATNDPNNNYWEGFRDAVHQTNPDAYIVLEEWGNASAWMLGDEMDATMNYQYSSAMLSFWRDTPFEDNDHNSGSSAGPLTPLTPSQLDARLHNWAERYPPEAYYAMMNLLGSHDTNRPLFFLDHNAANGSDSGPLQNPNYDWSESIARLKGVIILQMTLPGAPTIYYGDEVGLIGPTYHDGNVWQDDPYNRQPFPWLDESGTPFYTHLQTQAGQDNLRDYYKLLTGARNNHPALRTGSFDTLLVDNANQVYAYGRKMTDHSDAAIVIVNRAGTMATPITQTVTLTLDGYLPAGAVLTDTLTGNAVAVNGSGLLTVDVPGESGVVLVLASLIAPPPDPVSDLAVTAVRSDELDLGWTAVVSATSYDVYRSLVSGGGYTFITNTTATNYTDSGLNTGTAYYYVLVSVDAGGQTSGFSNEAWGIPQHDLSTAWYTLQGPAVLTHTISTITPTAAIYGQLYITGTTGSSGPASGIMAQIGYALTGTWPITDAGWQWVDMSYNGPAGSNDEYVGSLLPDQVGTYQYATRWTSNGGYTWFYADLAGPGYDPGQAGVLYVLPSSDTTPPPTPQNLRVDGTTPSSISLSWDPVVGTPDLAGYELYRQPITVAHAFSGGFEWLATVMSGTTSYVDTNVVTDQTYEYYVLAFDTSFNRSGPSNIVTATAESRIVAMTFRVGVPAYTPGTVYLTGDLPQLGPWNPSALPMTRINNTTWVATVNVPDGTPIEYKYTRGSWETVESWGSITGFNNRQTTADYGTIGTQTVNNTATDWGNGPDNNKAVRYWRDPLPLAYQPRAGAVNIPLDSVISVTWSITLSEPITQGNGVFEVTSSSGDVPGTLLYDNQTRSTIFTPMADFVPGVDYTVTIASLTSTGVPGGDMGTQQQPLIWSFFIPRPVTVTFRVRVPEFTPANDTIYMVGNIAQLTLWQNPGLVDMTQVGAYTWTHTLVLPERYPLSYKYTRGSWNTIEAWDSIAGFGNRDIHLEYGTDGTMFIDNTSTDWEGSGGHGRDDFLAVRYWRDPILVRHLPLANEANAPVNTIISMTWSIPMSNTVLTGTGFTFRGADGLITGTFGYYSATNTVFFTPSVELLATETYTVRVVNQIGRASMYDIEYGIQNSPVRWNFTIAPYRAYMPFVITEP